MKTIIAQTAKLKIPNLHPESRRLNDSVDVAFPDRFGPASSAMSFALDFKVSKSLLSRGIDERSSIVSTLGA